MKIHLLLAIFGLTALLFLAAPAARAQSEFAGQFSGTITQNEGGISNDYDMEMALKVSGDNVSGTTTFFLPGEKDVLVTYTCSGTIKGHRLVLHETDILNAQDINGYFCYKDMQLKLKGTAISGTWTSANCETAVGVIALKKK